MLLFLLRPLSKQKLSFVIASCSLESNLSRVALTWVILLKCVFYDVIIQRENDSLMGMTKDCLKRICPCQLKAFVFYSLS